MFYAVALVAFVAQLPFIAAQTGTWLVNFWATGAIAGLVVGRLLSD